MSGPDRRAAFKAERAELLSFCDSLAPAEWRMNSRAEGWSISDVVAHLAAGCHALFSPAALTIMRGDDVEQINDEMVAARRYRPPAEVLAEYRRWSRVLGAAMPAVVRTPLGRVQTPLAELGRFPARLLLSAVVFDTHTHLRHDMAPALGRRLPPTDANRMAVVLEWMTAVLGNQLQIARPGWLDRPLTLTLTGAGGGAWLIEPSGAVTAGLAGPSASQITAVATEFPEWGTTRAPWRERDVTVTGDVAYGERFLDAVNIV